MPAKLKKRKELKSKSKMLMIIKNNKSSYKSTIIYIPDHYKPFFFTENGLPFPHFQNIYMEGRY